MTFLQTNVSIFILMTVVWLLLQPTVNSVVSVGVEVVAVSQLSDCCPIKGRPGLTCCCKLKGCVVLPPCQVSDAGTVGADMAVW